MKNITIDDLYRTIGRNVARERKLRGYSQLDLSLMMGYRSVSVVSTAEVCCDEKRFNLEQLLKISQLFDYGYLRLLCTHPRGSWRGVITAVSK